MKAPEKIYLTKNLLGVLQNGWDALPSEVFSNIEYTRTDAFIEKACKAFCNVCKMPNCNSKGCSYLEDFRENVKGE